MNGDFESLLRAELRPLPAPEGFVDQVMRRQQRPRRQWPWAAIAAVLLVSFTSGAVWKHQRDQRLAGERARDQVLLALRITAVTLTDVQHKVLKGEVE